jgi:NAD+ kinase
LAVKKIQKVIAVLNTTKLKSGHIAEQIKTFFTQRNIRIELIEFTNTKESLIETSLKHVDLAISVGGDGTLLYCAGLVAGNNIPILAVNLGTFGFITEVSKNEWQEVYEKYVSGEISASKRIMLDVKVLRAKKEAGCYRGLNDGVIITSGIARLVKLDAYLSKTYIGRYRADGIIIATPTGSTAYSLSAGGPILHPEMEDLIISPICPFSLSHRPLVVPANEYIEIVVEEKQRTTLNLTVDGQELFVLEPKDRVIFQKSDHYANIINSDKRNFYEVLRTKLNWSGDANA